MSDVKALDINGTSYDVKAISVVDNGSGTKLKYWSGTKAEYDAITTKDSTMIYNVVDSGSGSDTASYPERVIGQIIQSTIPLTDGGLHLLDGALIEGSGSYTDFVSYIAGLYSSGDYSSIFETEANWQTSVNTYGVCGKFVYNSINNTVRLPKITGFTEGTIDPTVLGNLVQAGLPNITGYGYSVFAGSDQDFAGSALYSTTPSTVSYVTTNNSSGLANKIYRIDASRSNSIYDNSNTVQPQSIKVL